MTVSSINCNRKRKFEKNSNKKNLSLFYYSEGILPEKYPQGSKNKDKCTSKDRLEKIFPVFTLSCG